MKMATMRLLDLVLGIPICVILTWTRRLTDCLRRTPCTQIKRIAVIKLSEQGSTVLALQGMNRLMARFGRENVYFVVFKQNRFILDVTEIVSPENILTLSATGLLPFLVGTIRLILHLRRLRIDAVINLEFFVRYAAAVSYLSGALVRIGQHSFDHRRRYCGNLFTHRVRHRPDLHTSQMFDILFDAVGAPAGDLPVAAAARPVSDDLPRFHPLAGDLEAAKALLGLSLGCVPTAGLILMNPNSNDVLPQRQWPAENFVVLAQRLLVELPDIHIALTGTDKEQQVTEELAHRIGSGRCCSLAGLTTMRQLLTIYTLADALVTSDSGPAHFAALTPVNIVVIFGPETPKRFCSLSRRCHTIWLAMPCSPCFSAYNNCSSSCRDNLCMTRVSVEQVFDAVRLACAHASGPSGGANP
ncbi:MAG: glycosyltransferase family 9 protein [Planctomycetaceae bacterium]|nr:glycosyltransferase family 9 protein [Planctomycetaceae bacterium]